MRYRQISNIRGTLVGNNIVDHSDVVSILDLTPGFNGLGKDNCTRRRELFKFGDLVQLLLEIWRYVSYGRNGYCSNNIILNINI